MVKYFVKYLLILICAKFHLAQSTTVSITEDYTLSWELSGSDKIIFEVEVRTLGFVGFGLSLSGGMMAADIVVGGVFENGTEYFDDRHGVGLVPPVLDASQDYELLDANENGTHTKLRFSRLLKTCDEDDIAITSDTMKMIWSYGSSDVLAYHGTNRGVKSFQFLDPAVAPPDLNELDIWEMRANTTMPSAATTYWCTLYKTQGFTTKHHLVGFDAILETPESIQHTHHLDVYKCVLPDGESDKYFDPYIGTVGADCYAPSTEFFPHRDCYLLQYGWAIGGQTTMFPEKLGFPLQPNEVYMLEVHYDNPGRLANLTFDVGLKIYHTEKLRAIDAAYFMVNSVVSFSQMIPPRSESFIQTAHCSASCTQGFPEEGISVFNIFLHAHKAARKMRVRHFRDGKELPWIISDQSYDFNYQQNRPLSKEVKFLKGDHITIECTYDNTWKNGEATIGGRSTTEEMCMVMFFYYPLMQNIIECKSEMPVQKLLDFLGIEGYQLNDGEEDPIITAPEKHKGKRFQQVVKEFTWDNKTREIYQVKARTELQNGYCFPGGSNFTTGFPEYEKEYVQPDLCDLNSDSSGEKLKLSFGFSLITILQVVSLF